MRIWKQIVGYEGLYSASDDGQIRSEDRVVRHHLGGPKRLNGAVMRPYTSSHGYLMLTLCKENTRTKHAVHRLVLQAFSNDLGIGLDACHNDSDRSNNAISNLRWDDRKGNMADVKALGRSNRGERSPTAKISEEEARDIFFDKRPQKVIASKYKINQSTVSLIKNRKRWGHI